MARAVALTASVVGVAACLVATVASYWAASGSTPAWVYDRFETLSQFTTKDRVLNVPLEFVGAIWFAALAVLISARRSRTLEHLWPTAGFLSAIVLAGVAGLRVWTYGFASWVPVLVTLLSVLILVASASQPLPSWRECLTNARFGIGEVVASPRMRTVAVALLLLAAVGSGALRAGIGAVSPRQAAEENFLRWYASIPPVSDDNLNQSGRIKVVAFTDYQCRYAAAGIPEAERLVGQLRERSPVPIDLVVRDYPIDSACNPAYWGSLHRQLVRLPLRCGLSVAG